MSLTWLRASLALWKRRLAYRKAQHRKYHKPGSYSPEARRKELAAHWHGKEDEAARNIAQRERQIAARTRPAAPQKALVWARRWIGKTEQPPGSNKGDWGLTQWQQDLGEWLVGQAWCGTFVGTALIRAGVKGINSRVAGVILILDDALNSRNGFKSVVYRRKTGHGSVRAGKPGDAIGLFGESTHVGLIEKRVTGGYQTIEGNTSSGNSGSQSNGGGCYRRTRPDSAVVYIVRPRYPED